MCQLICRLSWDGEIPSAADAAAAHIDHWLVPTRVLPSGTVVMAVELEPLLAEHPLRAFSLEWQCTEALSPRQESAALEALFPWLVHPRSLRIGARPLLWIHAPDQLSHPLFAARRLRLASQEQVLLLAAGPPLPEGFEAGYERADRIPMQRMLNGQQNYESFLAYAHHRPRGDGRLLIPCVSSGGLAPMVHQSSALTENWLAQNQAWIRLSRNDPQERMVLLEEWPSVGITDRLPIEVDQPTAEPGVQPGEERAWGVMQAHHPAVLVHGYHLDLLKGILTRLPQDEIDLYVSTPHPQLDAVQEVLKQEGWPRVRLVGVTNRGRDMAPFLLELLPRALATGHPWLVKLHTKRSPDKPGGARWGQGLVESLTNDASWEILQRAFQPSANVCLAAPPGSLLPCTVCLGENAKHLERLLRRSGIQPQWLLDQPFVAGSMWAAPSSRLAPLMELGLSLDAFEPEAGQTDGTLAHALERLLPALLLHSAPGALLELPAMEEVKQSFGWAWALAPQPAGIR